MTDYALLEIGLHQHDGNTYRIQPRLWLPGEDAERGAPGDGPLLAHIDLEALKAMPQDDEGYGPLLTTNLFSAMP